MYCKTPTSESRAASFTRRADSGTKIATYNATLFRQLELAVRFERVHVDAELPVFRVLQ